MRTESIRGRTLEQSFAVSTAALVILVIGATALVVHGRVASALERALSNRGLAIANSIGAVARPSLLAYNYPALQVAAEGAVEDPALLYVAIHDREGKIAGVAGSLLFSSAIPSLPERITSSSTRRITLFTAEGEALPVLEAVVPVLVEGVGDPWGTVRVGLGYDSVHAEVRRLDIALGVSGLILALLAVASSRWMARRITAPLRRLAKGTVALSRGDTSYRIPQAGSREFVELSRAFNKMMERVEEKAAESTRYQQQLSLLNATLEDQVSERTRALEESEAQYRSLVEHSPDSILIVQQRRVRFVNRAFSDTFGIPEAQALSSEFRLESIFTEPESVAEQIHAWERGEAASPREIEARDADGRPRQLELRGSRIEYLGQPAAECLLVDMTETKRLRERLVDTERLRALGELASGVAHDFNNLLGAILGRIQLLRRRGFPHDVDGDMAVIEKAAMDGRETVRRVQEFSRLRTDRPRKSVDLGQIIADSVEITRTRWNTDAARRNIAIRVSTDCEPVPGILGNETELREVYTNLILNAIDAMSEGGELTLRCFDNDGSVRSEVEDTGIGMSDDTCRRLFDPFFTTKGMAGTGLGMSVAYGIVHRHGGTIEVRSKLGRGTRFVLEFPVSEVPVDVGERPAATSMRPAAPGRILVIDDDPSIAELLNDVLSAEGHVVDVAFSGKQAVELLDLSEFDMVMTDLGMPGMSGWDVAELVREKYPELPVVLVTGWGTTLSQDEVERCGVAAVVHKPFEISELVETTVTVLQRSEVDAAEPR